MILSIWKVQVLEHMHKIPAVAKIMVLFLVSYILGALLYLDTPQGTILRAPFQILVLYGNHAKESLGISTDDVRTLFSLIATWAAVEVCQCLQIYIYIYISISVCACVYVCIYIYIYGTPPHGSTDFGLKGLFGFTSATQHTIGGSMEGGFIAIGRRV